MGGLTVREPRAAMTLPDDKRKPMQQEPLGESAPYEVVAAALRASEQAISEALLKPVISKNSPAGVFGAAIGRRAWALSSGFRLMIEHRNSFCAFAIVRMQIDTVLRLHAGTLVTNHQKFCHDVLRGEQINHLKSVEGSPMTDHYLRKEVAKRHPWIDAVYEVTSGDIHFSRRAIENTFRIDEDGKAQMVVGPTDFDREPEHFLEPMRCMHHLNIIIEFDLRDWFTRMCDPNSRPA